MQGSAELGVARNRLLMGMHPQDRTRIWPSLHRENLSAKSYLERAGVTPASIYFVESGVVSVLESADLGDPLEVGLIGYEGMTGGSTILGNLDPQRDSIAQVCGHALAMPRSAFQETLSASSTLRTYLARYIQTQMVQLSLNTSASVRASVQQRLCRKLLMYHDRLGMDDMPLTHENMSIMLGVRRASITHAIHNLEAEGWIRAQRGLVTVRDREGLENYCGPFYGVAEARYALIMGEAPSHSGRKTSAAHGRWVRLSSQDRQA